MQNNAVSYLTAMILSNLNRLLIELINLDVSFPLAFVTLVMFTQVLLCIFLGWDTNIYSFLLGSNPSATHKQVTQLKNSKAPCKQLYQGPKEKNKNDESMFIWREEVETILKSLGLSLSFEPRTAKIKERMGSNDLRNLFEEKEASLDELKAAFDVFDENKDGFIDAFEMQRLMCALGLKEGLELHNCVRMIMVADEDGDGMIDFNEYAKFMENTIC